MVSRAGLESTETSGRAPSVSVIVPTHNRWASLQQVLEGFARQSLSPDAFELIVCDDASSDDTAERANALATRLPYSLRVMRQEKKGPAAARNRGAAVARGPVLAFTDDDCVPAETFLAAHLASTTAGVATIGHIEWHPDLTVTPFMEFVCPGYMFNFDQILDHEHATHRCFYTANVSVHRDDFRAVGCFDEGFPGPAYEDIELGYRLEASGVRLRYERQAVVYHLHEVTLAAQLPRQLLNGHAAAYAISKHPRLLLGAGRVLRLRDPGLRRRFYDAVLDYYYVVGLQEALGEAWGDSDKPEELAAALDDRLRAMSSDYEIMLETKFYEAERYARAVEDQLARLEAEYHDLAAWSNRLDAALRRANPIKNALRARVPLLTRLASAPWRRSGSATR